MNDHSPSSANGWATSLDDWGQRNEHKITLPSGARVVIRFADTGMLIRNGALPQKLKRVALLDFFDSKDAGERMAAQILANEVSDADEIAKEYSELKMHLAAEALIEPRVTVEQIEQGAIPPEDLEFIHMILTRERGTDARGVVLGVLPLDLFTTFREAHEDTLEEGHSPGLDPACPACIYLARSLSSLRLAGAM
jgi:hypothetical protein